MELGYITAAAAAEAVRKREITARELVESFLGRCTALNGRINSFIHIFERAMAQAEVVNETSGKQALPWPGCSYLKRPCSAPALPTGRRR